MLNALFCFSQNKAFKYIPTNKDSLVNYINNISEKKIIKLSAKNKKEIKTEIGERKTEFIKSINDSSYVFDENISNYLKPILNKIYRSNPEINNKDFCFLINKSPIPNAACYGNGIFTINIGLFNILDSDDELAFIVSHEIAHYILEHNDKSLLKYIETIKSKDTNSKIKAIENKEFGKRKAYSELMKDLKYNFLNRSRKAEIQADSLGFVIFNKTDFNKKSSANSLKKLDFINDMVFNEDTKIKSHFQFEEYPFKDSWLTPEETLFNIKEKKDDYALDRKSTRLNSSHSSPSRMPASA